jgi:mitochondrial fission protein ELM1
MVALWIREQSGGRTKIVLLGKPSGRVEWYDLIIASAEIILPPLPNVLAITLPLMQIDEAIIANAAEQWRPRLDALPRPLIGFLVGGPTEPFVYNAAMIKRLLRAAKDLAEETGGTAYFTTSRRTPAAVVEALRNGLPSGGRLFAWGPEAQDNPYYGLLALADGLVITGDSISMMVEAIRIGKPVAILPLPAGPIGTVDQWRRAVVRWLFAPGSGSDGAALRRAAGRLLYRLRVATHTRDFRAFHQLLLDRGLAVSMGQGFASARGRLPDDVTGVVVRIKALITNS